jgi:hypothetical protein
MIKIIATTISSSMREKPLCFRIRNFSLQDLDDVINGSVAGAEA